jgi:hypothetical protein
LPPLIAGEPAPVQNDVKPWAAASTLIGVRHALDDYTCGRILAGALSPGLAREVGSRGKRALVVLEAGLGN